MRICRSFKGVVICSAVVSVVCFVIGMAASYAFELPSGAAIVMVNITAFAAFFLCSFTKKGHENCTKHTKAGSEHNSGVDFLCKNS